MAVGAVRYQLDTDTKGMDAQDTYFDYTSDQVRSHLSPLRQWEIMDILAFYQGAHSFSLFSVSRLKMSIFACGISHSKPGPPS